MFRLVDSSTAPIGVVPRCRANSLGTFRGFVHSHLAGDVAGELSSRPTGTQEYLPEFAFDVYREGDKKSEASG